MNISNIGVMGLSPRQKTHPRRAAESSGHKVVDELRPLVSHMFHGQRSVRQRIQLEILVICHDEEEVRLLFRRSRNEACLEGNHQAQSRGETVTECLHFDDSLLGSGCQDILQ